VTTHQARKRFGQNFLIDAGVIDSIVKAIAPNQNDTLIEIGPGLSALTAPLVERTHHLIAIEIDRDLAAGLRQRFDSERLTVIEADALEIDFAQFGEHLRIVGNLPYNISTPILFALNACADRVIDQHFMLQREVVDRMVAKPGSGDFSRLSVMLQYRYEMHKLFDVDPSAFDPPPRVVSSIVRMQPLKADRRRAKNEKLFSELVARAFSQRRKMLRGVLSPWVALIPWEALGVSPTLRAEAVPVEAYIGMADALHEAGMIGLSGPAVQKT
jgi:16S rRNA (adenine1518-N6/adenine1519-N6)-dimethyltransferase